MRPVRLARGAAVAAMMVPAVAGAQTESRFSADITAEAGYASNPFTITGGDNGAALVTLDIAPRYQLLTPRSTITLSGDANLQQYLRRYGGNNSYSGAVDYAGRPSERVTTHARVELSSAVLGAYNDFAPILTGIDTGTVATGATGTTTGTGTTTATDGSATTLVPITTVTPLAPYDDVGLYGLRNRRRLGRASGDVDVALSGRDSVNVSGYAEFTRYHDLAGADYNAYGGSVGYSRVLSSRFTAGLRGSASSYDYRGIDSNSQAYSIEATGTARLSDRWTASGAIGVTFVNGDGLRSTDSTSLSGDLSLCRLSPVSSLCAQVARQVSPTGIAGSQYVTSAGLSYSRQLDERQAVSLSANYSRVGGDDDRLYLGDLPLRTDYVQASAGYNRRLGERLRFVASASYRQLLGGGRGHPNDIGGQIGLSYRLGDRR